MEVGFSAFEGRGGRIWSSTYTKGSSFNSSKKKKKRGEKGVECTGGLEGGKKLPNLIKSS